VFAVPSLYLLSGAYISWKEEMELSGFESRHLLIGSDADCEIAHFPSLRDFERTTKVEEIISFLSVDTAVSTYVWTTYQSARRLIDACAKTGYRFELMFCDEAHRTVGTGVMGSLVHCDIADKVRFMTATPRIIDTEGVLDDVRSMDDETMYGKCLGIYRMNQAIQAGVLQDYRIIIPMINDVETRELVFQQGIVKDKIAEFDAQIVLASYMIVRGFKAGDYSRMLCFSNRNERSRAMSRCIQTLDSSLTVMVLDGSSSMKTRKKIIRKFQTTEKSIICSARILLEGVDIKQCDGVCFADNKSSSTDIIQGIGRCQRIHPEKNQPSQVLIPCLLEGCCDIFDPMAGPHFRKLRVAMEALSNDQDLMDRVSVVTCNGLGDYARATSGTMKVVETMDQKTFLSAVSLHQYSRDGNCTKTREFNLLMRRIKGLFVSKEAYLDWAKHNCVTMEPEEKYSTIWRGWHSFLGINVSEFYVDYREAKQKFKNHVINRKLVIPKINKDVFYNEIRKFDKKLPTMPWCYYSKDWLSYTEFIGIRKRKILSK